MNGCLRVRRSPWGLTRGDATVACLRVRRGPSFELAKVKSLPFAGKSRPVFGLASDRLAEDAARTPPSCARPARGTASEDSPRDRVPSTPCRPIVRPVPEGSPNHGFPNSAPSAPFRLVSGTTPSELNDVKPSSGGPPFAPFSPGFRPSTRFLSCGKVRRGRGVSFTRKHQRLPPNSAGQAPSGK
ncbi:hypothetical protein HPB47_021361 [Ixodes persulcatus]|uniref:Uncharacterized protein n=1 Tax=Ixodes persulcatus TaxID=34615 RepID=A0AC60QCX9_IXOPE|nr:hypothetical protein HPB47_021361 [Ixodes persulcatus]